MLYCDVSCAVEDPNGNCYELDGDISVTDLLKPKRVIEEVGAIVEVF
jgi:hypothetical protein